MMKKQGLERQRDKKLNKVALRDIFRSTIKWTIVIFLVTCQKKKKKKREKTYFSDWIAAL